MAPQVEFCACRVGLSTTLENHPEAYELAVLPSFQKGETSEQDSHNLPLASVSGRTFYGLGIAKQSNAPGPYAQCRMIGKGERVGTV